jgi:hypothetical protein
VAVNLLKSYATRLYPDSWLIILGLIFILVVLFMPNGLVGLPEQIRGLFRKFRPASQPSLKETVEPSEA